MKYLFNTSKSKDSLIGHLEKHFHLVDSIENTSNIKDYALLVDYNSQKMLDKKYLDIAVCENIPILLLNTKAENMSKQFNVGWESRITIAQIRDGFTLFDPLSGIAQLMKNGDEETISITNEENVKRVISQDKKSDKSVDHTIETPVDTDDSLVIQIVNKLNFEYLNNLNNLRNENFTSPPTNLPTGQYSFNYVNINSNITDLVDGQTASNNCLMEITLIASFNPKNKYLRIRSMGAGFHPANGANIKWDGTYDRGYFQNRINVHMEPSNSKLNTYETSPKNVNGQTSYTTGSSLTVGVDISKNPGFKPSYTISESTSATISDFDIQNDSSSLSADWNFQLGMSKNSIWDMFNEPFMRKGQVKGLPNLAKKNLQTQCEGLWYVDDSSGFNDSVPVQLHWTVWYYNCWVTGDWVSYTKHYQRKSRGFGFWKGNPFHVNFGSVSS